VKFIQVIEYTTTRFEEVDKLVDGWVTVTKGRRTATHAYTGLDRETPDRYIDIVVFPSYEEAMRNNKLPETMAMAERWMKLCKGEPVFRNLDVVREDNLA